MQKKTKEILRNLKKKIKKESLNFFLIEKFINEMAKILFLIKKIPLNKEKYKNQTKNQVAKISLKNHLIEITTPSCDLNFSNNKKIKQNLKIPITLKFQKKN